MKKTVVVGAGPESYRYGHRAVVSLMRNGIDVVPVGLHKGEINGQEIHTEFIDVPDVHTVTIYVHPRHQNYWKDYILSLKPKRAIFNPGAENPEMIEAFQAAGITCQESCTLVMLSVGTY